MPAFLGLDVGTTAVKCLATDEQGRVLASAAADYPLHQPRPGWVEQDPADWKRLVTATVREVVSQLPSPVVALAISTQGDTAVPVDARGRSLAPARTWMDTRPTAEVARLRAFPEERWHALTGAVPAPYATLPSILWWRDHLPEAHAIHRICLVQDYLVEWLTGEALLDAPNASRTLLYDINRRAWSPELLDFAAVDEGLLAATAESGTVVGPLRQSVAAELHLPPGVQVVLGGHDQTCAAVGCGLTEPGGLMLSCGTAWVVLAATAGPLPDPSHALHTYCHALPGAYALLGAYAGGNLFQWFRDHFASDLPPGGAYETLLVEAARAEAAGRPPVWLLPHFYGSFIPDPCPEALGAWLGLTLAHTREDLALGLLTGVALQTASVVTRMTALGAEAREVRMIGGGARSPLWAQLVADALQQPVVLPPVTEAAALGAALLAIGATQTARPGAVAPAASREVSPRPSPLPEARLRFEQVSRRLNPLWTELSRLS